jgi:hypothetical protein
MDALTQSAEAKTPENRSPIPMGEFVALIASIMALTALGIDSMLPALPAIADQLGVSEPNHRQYVITAFMLGFAVAQLVHGPLADRFGRKPVIGVALAFYVVTNLVAASANSFGCGRPRRHGGAGARLFSGARDGAGDEPRVHDLHGRARARACLGPVDGDAVRFVADHLRGDWHDRRHRPGLVPDSHARNAGPSLG